MHKNRKQRRTRRTEKEKDENSPRKESNELLGAKEKVGPLQQQQQLRVYMARWSQPERKKENKKMAHPEIISNTTRRSRLMLKQLFKRKFKKKTLKNGNSPF